MIDVSTFYKYNVADTCAVWNLLSASNLLEIAATEGCKFCLTGYVTYECLDKPRTRIDEAQQSLLHRLKTVRQAGGFPSHSISMDDLLEIELLQKRRNLGLGELSTIAFAMTTRQAAFSDDTGARKLASEILGREKSQTTCHLFGWLFFTDRLADGDCLPIVAEHKRLGGSLEPHLIRAYELAMQARLHASANSTSAS